MGPDDIARERDALHRQSEKMEAVGMLARGIAHDFNNILSGVLGFTSYLKSKAKPGSDLHRDLGLIEEAGGHAAELTQKLFLIARRRHGAREPVLMNQVITDTLAAMQYQMPAGVHVETEFSPHLPPVLGDAVQFGTVIRNLCLRALSAMTEHGGKIHIKAESRPLTKHEEAMLVNTTSPAYVCISIQDTGRGMSPDMRDHIFDPFSLSRTSRDGPGLDMSIVYGIVANHLGNIRVESEEGLGTTFRLYLPVHESAVGEVLAEEQMLSGSETVLVVDDEIMVREMVEWILEAKGYKVLTASSGEEALEIYGEERGHIDMVLLDIMMPGMGGEEAFHKLRAANPDVRVLLTSIHTQEELGERLTRAGAKGIVFKPYRSNALLVAVRKALST